jgi:hypothetical protein
MIESTASRQGPCDQPIYEDEQIRGDSLSCTDKTFPTFSLCASANGSFLPPFFIALVDFSLNPVSIVPGQTAATDEKQTVPICRQSEEWSKARSASVHPLQLAEVTLSKSRSRPRNHQKRT